MAINLLGQLPTPTTNYSSLTYQPVNASQAPASSSVSPLATSTVTKLPTAGTINGVATAPMGVKPVSPTTNISGPSTTLASSQIAKAPPQSTIAAPFVNTPQNTPAYDPTTGFLTDYGKSIGAKPVQPNDPANQANTTTNTQSNTQTTPAQTTQSAPAAGTTFSNGQDTTFSGLLGAAASAAGSIQNQAATENQTAQQIGAQTQMSPAELQANLNAVTAEQQRNAALAASNGQGWSNMFQQGQEGLINRTADVQGALMQAEASKYADQRGVAATALGAEATAQNNAGGLLNNAASSLNTSATTAAPVTQFGQLTNPQTGAVVSPAGGNPQLNTAVQQAAQLIKNGASIADATAASGLSAFGVPGTQALTSLLSSSSGGTYNPSAVNAITQQNLTQGATYQGVAQELSNAIQTMQPIAQKLVTFIQQTGQNPATSPLVNTAIENVNAQLYPAQVATLNAAVNDIRSYAIQVLGSQSGANPTDVTSALNSFDFSKFSANDLNSFLGDLQNMANTRLSQAQSAMNAGYGSNTVGSGPAAGVAATGQGDAFNTGSMSPSSAASNLGKAVLGAVAGVVGSAVSGAGEAVSGAATGAAAGAAESLFGSGAAAAAL